MRVRGKDGRWGWNWCQWGGGEGLGSGEGKGNEFGWGVAMESWLGGVSRVAAAGPGGGVLEGAGCSPVRKPHRIG